MRLLLDTHVWLWMGLARKRLGKKTRAILEDRDNELALSVASVWELILKYRRGSLELPMDPSEYVRTRLRRSGVSVLDIRLDHVLALDSLEGLHRDPFDRILAAQALAESQTLVTADPQLLEYPILALDART